MAKCVDPGKYGPCRKCPACVDRRARSWVLRMILESMLYPPSHVTFLTLTYRQKDLPHDAKSAKKTVQNFIKRVRRDFGIGRLRYFAALEKGTRGTRRFHWHVVMYGLRFSSANRHFIEKKWSLGFIHWTPISPARISYTAKYAVKDKCYLMSRKPGLGDGMIKHINKRLYSMSEEEITKLNSQFGQEVQHFYTVGTQIFVKRHWERLSRTISALRVGGYYFPLHEYLRKRLRDFRSSYGKKETEKSK